MTTHNLTWSLDYQDNRLSCCFTDKTFAKPLYVDFEKQRYQKISRQEHLIKAVGAIKKGTKTILDLTAGLGSDAYLLYCAGYQVQLVERSPTIAALLQDGLVRAGCDMPLHIGEATVFLKNCLQSNVFYDTIYFDPIFPEKTKSALAQKSARVLRAIVGEDEDAPSVFTLACQVAKKRVVVKRPRHGTTVTAEKPDFVYSGKAIRFDVYSTIKNTKVAKNL